MADYNLQQMVYETETWKRSLGFMLEENVQLKIRVSEILKDIFEPGLLDPIEEFQGKFIREDEMIRLLRNEVAELNTLFQKDPLPNETSKQVMENKLKKLRFNIRREEENFGKLKADFHGFLSEYTRNGRRRTFE